MRLAACDPAAHALGLTAGMALADARARVIELIDRAHIRQARRVATKPSKAAKARRVDAKKGRSTVKKNRGKVSFD